MRGVKIMKDHIVTYLQDHLAASVAGIELAKRCRDNNRGSELGLFLDKFVDTLEREQARIREMLDRLGASEPTVKKMAAWAAEKITRLKLNDSLLNYSDLGRVVELEALLAGLQSQIAMWRILQYCCSIYPPLGGMDFENALKEAEASFQEMTQHHLLAARIAFCKS
jgi:hypothetical protein